MTKLRPLATLTFAIMLLAGGSSCSLLYSRKATLKRYLNNFAAAVNQKDWTRAAKLMTSDFAWYPHGQVERQGRKAFLRRLDEMAGNEYIVAVNKTTEVADDKLLTNVTFQVRSGGATGSENRLWDANMLWRWDDEEKGWRIEEVKDMTAEEYKRS